MTDENLKNENSSLTENTDESTEDVLEPVLNADTGEVVAVKFKGKELTPTELKRILDRDKNLEAGFTKKMQELSEREKMLSQKMQEFDRFEQLLNQYPEAKQEMEAVLKKYAEGNLTKKQANTELETIKKELEELKMKEQKKEKEEQIKVIVEEWNKKIDEKLKEKSIENETFKKLVKKAVWAELLVRDIDEAELEKIITEASSLLPNAKLKDIKKQELISAKGGVGVKSTDGLPPIGSDKYKDHLKNTFNKHFSK